MKFTYYVDLYPFNNDQYPPLPTTQPMMPKPDTCKRFVFTLDFGNPFDVDTEIIVPFKEQP